MNSIHTPEEWAKHLTAWAETGRPNLSGEALIEIAAYLTAYADPRPADFVHQGIKVGPEHDASVVLEMPTGEVIQVWAYGNDTGRPVVYQWDDSDKFEMGYEQALQIDVPRRANVVRRIHFDHLEYCIELFDGKYYVHVLEDNSEDVTGRDSESPELNSLADALKWVTDDFTGQILGSVEK